MPSLMEIVVRAQDQASQVLEGVGEAGGKAGQWIEDNWVKATAVMAGAGAGMEGLARKQAPLTEQSRRLAASLGQTEGEVRDLALGMANVTFPLEDALDLMETGRQRGIKSAEQLEEYATFWDMVGDATGGAGPDLAKAGVALEQIGVSAGNESEALAAFGFITEETTGNVDDFLRFIERVGPELNDMGADVNDSAAILGVLENELGLSGRVARQEFRRAIAESDGTLEGMLDTLGVTAEQFAEYQGKVAESSGVIERNAEIHAESYTPIQRLQHALSELAFRYGGVFEAASSLAPILIAAGPAMRGVKAASDFLGSEGLAGKLIPAVRRTVAAIGTKIAALASWAAATAAQGARALASMAVTTGQFIAHYARLAAASLANAARMAASWVIAMGPVGWVIAAVVGLVALIIANWDKVVAFTKAAWDAIMRNVVDPVVNMVTRVVEWVRNLRDRVTGFMESLRVRAIAAVQLLVARYIEFWLDLINRVIGFATNLRDRVVGLLTSLKDRAIGVATGIRDGVVGFFRGLRDRAVDLATGLVDQIVGRFETIISFITGMPGKIARAASGMWDGITSAFRGAINAIIRGWNRIEFRVPGFKIGPVGYDGFVLGLPDIPQLAQGGIVRARPGGMLAILGEGGRDEAVIPLPSRGLRPAGPDGTADMARQLARLVSLLERRRGDRMVLRVGDREFVAFLQEVAGGAIDQADRDLMSEVRAGPGAF